MFEEFLRAVAAFQQFHHLAQPLIGIRRAEILLA